MPPPHRLGLAGGWRSGALELDGREEGSSVDPRQAVQHWTLRYDAAREQLVGERNGAAIRLARLLVLSPPAQQCGSPPP